MSGPQFRLVRAALVFGLLGLSVAVAQEDDLDALPNLLTNPSVEIERGGRPTAWTGGKIEGEDRGGPVEWNSDSAYCVWDGQVAHSGKRSLRAGPVPAGQKAVMTGWRSDKIPLKPCRLTFYSAWTKSNGNGRWGSLIKLDVYDKQGKWLCKFDPYIRDEHDWRFLSASGATPPATAYGVMQCYLYYDLGVTVWFDDIAVRQAEEGIKLHPAEGETVPEPTPILAWPWTPGKSVQIARDFAGGDILTYNVAPNHPLSLHVPKPLDDGEWSWRVVHEEKVKDETVTRVGEVHRFAVKRPPYARYAFDFGGEKTPVEPGFTAVTPNTAYDAAAGYGWVDTKGLTAHNQPDKEYRIADEGYTGGYAGGNRQRTFLTPLLRDLVQGTGQGTFKLNLPDGLYDIYLVAGHCSAGHAPAYADFDVWVQGKKAANVCVAYPGVFFDYKRCTAQAEKGELEIAFRSDKLDRVWFVNGLLILPRSARRQARWETDRLWRSICYIPDDVMWSYMPYPPLDLLKEPKTPPAPLPTLEDHGIIAFSHPMYDNIYAQTVPRSEDRVETLGSFATPGEVVDLTFSAYALRDLDDVSVSVGALKGQAGEIGAAASQARKVVVNALRHSPRAKGDYYRLEPDRIEAFETVDLDQGRSQQFWLTVSVPPEARGGTYSGAVRLASGDRTLREIPIQVEVLPFGLLPHSHALDVYFGAAACRILGGSSAAVRAEANRLRTLYMQDMNAHLQGCNLGLADVGLSRGKDGTIAVDTSPPKRSLQEYRDAGVRVTWARVSIQNTLGQLARLVAPAEADKFDKHIKAALNLPDSYYDELAKVVARIDEVAREGGVQRVMYMIWDECYGHDLPLVIGAAKAIRTVVKDALIYCNVPKNVYYGFGDTKPEYALAPHCNVWWVYGTLDDEERAREEKRGTLLLGAFAYGPPANSRSTSGFLMWRRGLVGANMWAHDAWYASASSQLDGPSWGDGCQVYPTSPFTPRLTWEATRQGIYDLRYLLTLEDMIARSEKDGKRDAAAAARQWRDKLWAALDPTKNLAWQDTAAYQQHRRQIADLILALIRAGVAPAALRTE